MTTNSFTENDITDARVWLADLALAKANEAAERVGFGWSVSSGAPSSYEEVSVEFAECLVNDRGMRVSIANMVPSVFGSARAAAAMRFWHHVAHVEMDADFGFLGEMKVAEVQLAAVVEAGMPEDSLAWHLMRADTMGLNYVSFMTHGGTVDRLAFAMIAVTVALPFAVLAAVEQIEGRPITRRDTATLVALMEATS